jgi:GAF domain-containing protein/HAMP domain-containing protein
MSTETTIKDQTSTLLRLLKRNGRVFISLVVALAQLPFFVGAVIGVLIIQTNAGLNDVQLNALGIFSGLAVLADYLLLIPIVFVLTSKANNRLATWSETGELSHNSEDERAAWTEIASIPETYGWLAGVILSLVNVVGIASYQYFWMKTSVDQTIYIALGTFAPILTTVILAVLLIDRMLFSAREVLLPTNFEDQLQGGSNNLILVKQITVGLALVIITVLLVGPIGYHKANQVIYENINSQQVIWDLRVQLIAASILALLVGLGVSLILFNSIKNPIDTLLQTFIRVERGDLSQRAKVESADELGTLAIYFNRMIVRLDELQQNLEKRVDDRTKQLRLSNEVGRIASTILDPEVVITKVVNLITQSFDYYYTAIFIVSSNGRWAELKDASGSAGAILKARRHRLQIGSSSLVGAAISTREPQVALDSGVSAIRFNNPLLPNTRSEIAIPLMMGDRVIGALNVQSTREADFKPDTIVTLQSMANQVAIAIENARLFKEMDQTVEELRLINRQYVVSAWSDKLKSNKLEYSTRATGPMEGGDAEIKEVEVGLNLRDEKIGQILIETGGEWMPEDQVWVEALATQVAISLENARLIEESQQSALRERLSAAIVQKLWSSNSVDSILQTAVRELGRALEASEVAIELNVEE